MNHLQFCITYQEQQVGRKLQVGCQRCTKHKYLASTQSLSTSISVQLSHISDLISICFLIEIEIVIVI